VLIIQKIGGGTMNFNIFLLRFGLDPDNFINKFLEPIKTEFGFIYEVEQRTDLRQCPTCKSHNSYVNNYFYIKINCSENNHLQDVLRIKKVRFKCNDCQITFTPKLAGIKSHTQISDLTRQLIISDFMGKLTFTEIAHKYHLTKMRIIQLFDEHVKYVPRLAMPRVLCIDEIRFSEEFNQNYVCVLTNFDTGEIVDIIRNRQMAYLREYFAAIPIKERETTKVLISDMYEAYDAVCRHYFPNAMHVIDLFHVITQLTNAVNRLRTRAMNTIAIKGSNVYNFMKSHWKLFFCRYTKIPDKFYTYKRTGEIVHYDDMVFKCVKISESLWSGYNILQELFKYGSYANFEDAVNFVLRISKRLIDSGEEMLIPVGRTYYKWRFEIANGLARTQGHRPYSNSIAEVVNNHLKTIIKSAYGYHNFQRFRKRALLISSNRSSNRKEL
jgi:transposase